MSTNTPSGSQHTSKKSHKNPRKDPFIIVTPREASGRHVDLSSRRVAAQIYLDHLRPTAHQRSQIEDLYEAGHAFEHLYRCLDQEDQLSAAALLASLGLDTDTRESVANRWHTRWSQPSGQNAEKTWRVLYQWCVRRNCNLKNGRTNRYIVRAGTTTPPQEQRIERTHFLSPNVLHTLNSRTFRRHRRSFAFEAWYNTMRRVYPLSTLHSPLDLFIRLSLRSLSGSLVKESIWMA